MSYTGNSSSDKFLSSKSFFFKHWTCVINVSTSLHITSFHTFLSSVMYIFSSLIMFRGRVQIIFCYYHDVWMDCSKGSVLQSELLIVCINIVLRWGNPIKPILDSFLIGIYIYFSWRVCLLFNVMEPGGIKLDLREGRHLHSQCWYCNPFTTLFLCLYEGSFIFWFCFVFLILNLRWTTYYCFVTFCFVQKLEVKRLVFLCARVSAAMYF